jgi:ADP-heptose:LPS heptosyltransferase
VTPTVVALRASGLGDLLTAVPALRGVRRAWPEHRLVVATPIGWRPLVEAMGIDAVTVDRADLGPLALAQPADVGVNLHGRGPQSHRVLLDAGVGELVAFTHPEVPVDGPLVHWDENEHDVHRWCRLLSAHGIAADPDDLRLEAPAPIGPAAGVVIHPGAASAARRWPVERWAAVARHLHDRGHRITVTAAGHETERALEVAQRSGRSIRVVAGTTPAELLAIVAHADAVLCADTGVAHLASAFERPSVVLFGPTPPLRWGPPDRPWHRVLWAGRTGDPHGRRVDPGLLEISVADVTDAWGSLITTGGSSSAP